MLFTEGMYSRRTPTGFVFHYRHPGALQVGDGAVVLSSRLAGRLLFDGSFHH